MTATTSAGQGYIEFNNTLQAFANWDVNFVVDHVIYTNKTANASGFLSFNYTNFIAPESTHTFKWVLNVPGYDINQNGIVDGDDLAVVFLHFGESTG